MPRSTLPPTAEWRASPAPSAHGRRPLRARPHPPAAVVEREGRTASARAVSPPLSPARARIRVWPCSSASTSSPTEPHFSLGSRDQGLSKSYIFCDFPVDFQVIFVHRDFAPNSWNFFRGSVARIFLSNIASIPLLISRKLAWILSFPQIRVLDRAFGFSLDSW